MRRLAVKLGIAAQGMGTYVASIVGAMVLIFILKVLGIFKSRALRQRE